MHLSAIQEIAAESAGASGGGMPSDNRSAGTVLLGVPLKDYACR